MGKRGKNQKKGLGSNPKKSKLHHKDVDLNDMEDEIDAFHKKRDIIPLDVNADVDSDDDDDEQPVFDYKGIDGDDDDEEDDDDEDEYDDRGLAAKIKRQQKYLREKFGGLEDDMHDDGEEDEKKRTVWSRGKNIFYGADNANREMSSDEDTAAEEEEEVIKLQKERAAYLRAEDFGLPVDEQDDSDEEPTLEEMMVKGITTLKSSQGKDSEGDVAPIYEEVKKDLSALSRDEQMAVVYSSAPELVNLLAELNDAYDELETQVNPILDKVRKLENAKKEGIHYLELKKLLLLSHIQAITFYLLLKSEGQPIRDHPVVARLVEIKSLLNKLKELDGNLPDALEGMLKNSSTAPAQKPAVKPSAVSSDLYTQLNNLHGHTAEKLEASKFGETAEPVKEPSAEAFGKKRRRAEQQDNAVSLESEKMLKYRAELEEKLRQKGNSGSVHAKNDKSKKQKRMTRTGQLETADDFDDDAMDVDGTAQGNGRHSTVSNTVSKFISGKGNSRKGVSGDDDLPERDDLGERRWKHELRVLAGAGVKAMDDDAKPENESASEDAADVQIDNDASEDEFYKEVKNNREAKLAMKAQKYSRNGQVSNEPETTADGKRYITTQIEKNRGLTRVRNKKLKNPRKKNRLKHEKAVARRKGQVRDIKKQTGSYGGEGAGINARISHSIRF